MVDRLAEEVRIEVVVSGPNPGVCGPRVGPDGICLALVAGEKRITHDREVGVIRHPYVHRKLQTPFGSRIRAEGTGAYFPPRVPVAVKIARSRCPVAEPCERPLVEGSTRLVKKPALSDLERSSGAEIEPVREVEPV